MTINFWMPQAPVERVVPYADEPEYFEVREIDGFEGINITAGNANAILALIDPQSVNPREDPYGEWIAKDFPRIITACLIALNTGRKDQAIKPDHDTGPRDRYCRVISQGRSVDYVQQRLQSFKTLCEVAAQHGFTVNFG